MDDGAADMAVARGTSAPALVQQLFKRHLISDLTMGAEK
jgi:hypothetical protein